MSNWLRVSGAGIVVLVCLFFVGRGFLPLVEDLLPPREPKFVPQLTSEQLKEKIQVAQGPVLVFFYNPQFEELERQYFPALDQLANQFNDKISFYRYQLTTHASDPFSDQYSGYAGYLVLFQNGRKTKDCPIQTIYDTAAANRGSIFLFVKEYTGIEGLPPSSSSLPIKHLSHDDFQELVLNSQNLVLVDFTAFAHCPNGMKFHSDFEHTAAKYKNLADFYFCDVEDFPRMAHVSKKTLIALFYHGKCVDELASAYVDSTGNEAEVLGSLIPYL